MPRKHKRSQKLRKHKRRITMRGGAFSPDQLYRLSQYGFNEYQIEQLEEHGIPFADIVAQSDAAMMQESDGGYNGNSDDFAEMMMNQLLHPNNGLNVPPMDDDMLPMDDAPLMDDDLFLPDDDAMTTSTQGPMELDELNVSQSDAYTTDEDMSGGRRRRRKTRRKTRRTKKGKSRRRVWKGGRCLGSGVGANTNDPNFSIYNTRALQLFPYRP